MVRLELAYDGTGYAGWQVQPNVPTIQGTVLAAARSILGEGIRLTGASRTDAGVHALRQVASLTLDGSLDAPSIGRALNATLPPDIRVLEASEVSAPFDARRSAAGKRYAYVIDAARVASPLLRRFAWHVPLPLALVPMRAALAAMRGTHDFSAFCAAAGRDAAPVCHVRAVHVIRRRTTIAILISADRFLHHMVRNIVGSAVAVGRGAKPARWMSDVLASRDRRTAGATAPPHGLILVRVRYPSGTVG